MTFRHVCTACEPQTKTRTYGTDKYAHTETYPHASWRNVVLWWSPTLSLSFYNYLVLFLCAMQRGVFNEHFVCIKHTHMHTDHGQTQRDVRDWTNYSIVWSYHQPVCTYAYCTVVLCAVKIRTNKKWGFVCFGLFGPPTVMRFYCTIWSFSIHLFIAIVLADEKKRNKNGGRCSHNSYIHMLLLACSVLALDTENRNGHWCIFMFCPCFTFFNVQARDTFTCACTFVYQYVVVLRFGHRFCPILPLPFLHKHTSSRLVVVCVDKKMVCRWR